MSNVIIQKKILNDFRIPLTEGRLKILSVIIQLGDTSFRIDDIVHAAKEEKLQMAKTSITNILRLFAVRGIIQIVEPKRTMKRGRPATVYMLVPKIFNPYKPAIK